MCKKLLVGGLFLAIHGVAVAGAPLRLDRSDLEDLEDGEVVVRPPGRDGLAIGVVDVPASADAVWDAILDFDARAESVGVLRSVEVYAPASDPEGLGASFHLRVLGDDIRYHLRYQVDRDANLATFALDPEREHDIVEASGSYEVVPLDDGWHRVIFRSRTDTGRPVPGFVKKMLANESLRDQLEEMRLRASGR